ncbi:MAG: hypothetical protein SPI77_02245 [Corynebacterium sp.]|nr:hypothetical protein [Corynebacterium sp.]
MATTHAPAPLYDKQGTYVSGYKPTSFVAPHSSLNKLVTWIGMAFLLAATGGLGMFVYALAGGAPNQNSQVLVGFAVVTVVFVVLGALCIAVGRKDWKKYSKATGYKH